ncbi:MAG: aminopeptidase P family protein [Corynebacterium sp.]|uniref:M24 family metallopeptidase n=1 Tax=Corynebacterium sp. TaxID=1720 RepID=UPI0026DA8B06|nr:aminopeptidase P family protein [Corynebacterium sp.]MDO5029131.1 aminopeptidase P family protein [Corynebacterium sp.]
MTNNPTTDYVARRAALIDALPKHGCDGFLTVDPTHVGWLTGFHGSNAGLLIAANGKALLSTDGRYTVQAGKQAPDVELLTARDTGTALLGQARGLDIAKLGIESEFLTMSAFDALNDARPQSLELVSTAGVVAKLRELKSDAELVALRHVADIAVRAFEDLLHDGIVVAGRTEREVAAELEYRMRMHGADRPSFDTIVASGPNSAKPHHGAEDRVIEAGDLVTIDFGAFAGGYNSDMTRTLFAADAETVAAIDKMDVAAGIIAGVEQAEAKSREIYNVVLDAQLAGVAAAVPGAKLVDVDAACRDIIEKAGYGEYFVHSTGHGVGIEVHEAPFAARTGKGELVEGMTLTIEPGIYVPEFGGVRIEDTLIVTDGEPEIITELPKPRA